MPYIPEVFDMVDRLRKTTPCARCGKTGRIEWHNVDHERDPRRRVSTMVWSLYTADAVMSEISVCEPLCRSCHASCHGQVNNRIWPACGHDKDGNDDGRKTCPACRRRRQRDYMRRKRAK